MVNTINVISIASIIRSRAAPRYISQFTQSGVAGWGTDCGEGGGCVGAESDSDTDCSGGADPDGGAVCSGDDESDGGADSGGAGSGADSVVKAPTALQAL